MPWAGSDLDGLALLAPVDLVDDAREVNQVPGLAVEAGAFTEPPRPARERARAPVVGRLDQRARVRALLVHRSEVVEGAFDVAQLGVAARAEELGLDHGIAAERDLPGAAEIDQRARGEAQARGGVVLDLLDRSLEPATVGEAGALDVDHRRAEHLHGEIDQMGREVDHAAAAGELGVLEPRLFGTVGVVEHQSRRVELAELTAAGEVHDRLDRGEPPVAEVDVDQAVLRLRFEHDRRGLGGVGGERLLAEDGQTPLQTLERLTRLERAGRADDDAVEVADRASGRPTRRRRRRWRALALAPRARARGRRPRRCRWRGTAPAPRGVSGRASRRRESRGGRSTRARGGGRASSCPIPSFAARRVSSLRAAIAGCDKNVDPPRVTVPALAGSRSRSTEARPFGSHRNRVPCSARARCCACARVNELHGRRRAGSRRTAMKRRAAGFRAGVAGATPTPARLCGWSGRYAGARASGRDVAAVVGAHPGRR